MTNEQKQENKEKCGKCHVRDCPRNEKYCNSPIKEYCPSLIHSTPEPTMSEDWIKKFLQKGTENHCGDLSIMISTVSEIILKARQQENDKVKPIFQWLMGIKDDFPDLSQKPHYSFRTELRQKLEDVGLQTFITNAKIK